MPKKIYPFAIIISLTLVLIVFYILNQGHIEKIGHSSVHIDVAKENKVLYVGYNMAWKGYGNPKLKEVILLNKAGNSEFENRINMTPFVETSSSLVTDILTETEVNEGGYAENYFVVTNYKVAKPSFRFVLKLDFDHEKVLNEVTYLHVKYNTFGIMKEQTIEIANVLEE